MKDLPLVVFSPKYHPSCRSLKRQGHCFRVHYRWLGIQNRSTQSCKGNWSGKADTMDTDMLANALGLSTVSFGVRVVAVTTNVMKNSKRTHVATAGGVAHSSWLGVLLHLDDDFFHCLR